MQELARHKELASLCPQTSAEVFLNPEFGKDFPDQHTNLEPFGPLEQRRRVGMTAANILQEQPAPQPLSQARYSRAGKEGFGCFGASPPGDS
jgi:hypothetical protein